MYTSICNLFKFKKKKTPITHCTVDIADSDGRYPSNGNFSIM